MKTSKIVVKGHGWNRVAAVRITVGLVSLLTVALASGAGSHSVHAASGPGSQTVTTAGNVWG